MIFLRHALVIALLAGAPVAAQNTGLRDPDSMLQDAGRALASGNQVKAEEELQWILSRSPENDRALDLLGILRAQQQRNSEAEELFEHAIKNRPDFASPHIDLGLLYVQMSEPDKAVEQLEDGLRMAPDRADASNALAGVLRDQAREVLNSDIEKSLSLLLHARKIAPENPDVQFDLGMVELRMSLLPDAVDAFQQVLKLRSNDAPAIYGLGRAYLEWAKFSEARQQFEQYVKLQPNDASGHYGLGMSCAALQLAPEARAEFEKSIALAPVQTESYFRLGLLDLDAEDYSPAEKNFQHVLDRNPHHAGALAAMGRAMLETKKYDQAADLLQRAVASDASLREAHYYLGLTYARLGRKQESDEQLQIATQLEKESSEKQRTVFKILNPGNAADSPAAKP